MLFWTCIIVYLGYWLLEFRPYCFRWLLGIGFDHWFRLIISLGFYFCMGWSIEMTILIRGQLSRKNKNGYVDWLLVSWWFFKSFDVDSFVYRVYFSIWAFTLNAVESRWYDVDSFVYRVYFSIYFYSFSVVVYLFSFFSSSIIFKYIDLLYNFESYIFYVFRLIFICVFYFELICLYSAWSQFHFYSFSLSIMKCENKIKYIF